MFRIFLILVALFMGSFAATETYAQRYQYNPSRNNGVRYCYNPNCTMCNTIWGPMPGYTLTADMRSHKTPAVQPQVSNFQTQPRIVQPTVAPPITTSPITTIVQEDPDTALLPTSMNAVAAMLELVKPKKDQWVYDLGAGDGRIVIKAAVEYEAFGLGVEINPESVAIARRKVEEAGVSERVLIVEGDILKFDFEKADIITIYLFPDLIEKLAPLITKPGTVVISANHDIPGKKTDKRIVEVDGVDTEFFIWHVD